MYSSYKKIENTFYLYGEDKQRPILVFVAENKKEVEQIESEINEAKISVNEHGSTLHSEHIVKSAR